MHAIAEAMADNDEVAALARLFAHGRRVLRLFFQRQIVLRDGFEHREELAAGSRDFPTVVAAHDITVAKNIDGRHARSQSPDTRLPFIAAGGEDRDIPIEGGERRATAVMTGQYF